MTETIRQQITEKGYFIQGRWIPSIHPSLIGKKIIRTEPCKCPGGIGEYLDYSHCINGKYGFQPDEWSILKDIVGGCLVIEWAPRMFPGKITTLEKHWNDGNWIEVI